MATADLFGSRDIPLHIAEHIFYLAGPEALTSVRCTSKINAEAYSDVALSLAKRGQWCCLVDSPERLQFAAEHKLRCLHVVAGGITSLLQLASLGWLRELYIENGLETFDPADLTDLLAIPPTLVSLKFQHLGLVALPAHLLPPEAALKRLVWCEAEGANEQQPIRRMGRLPSSLVHLQCNVDAYLDLPGDLPPSLQHLDLDSSRLREGVRLPGLPAALPHLSLREINLTELPGELPSQLTRLDCSWNQLTVLPPLPDA